MNINPLIEKAFENYNVPIEYMTFTGKADKYLTYYTWKEEPDDFCDDENNIEVAFGTIDIFSKGNLKDILNDVKNILKSNGFLVTDVASEMYEEDTKYYHVPVNFCKEGEIEDA